MLGVFCGEIIERFEIEVVNELIDRNFVSVVWTCFVLGLLSGEERIL